MRRIGMLTAFLVAFALPPANAKAQDDSLVTFQVLSPGLAMELVTKTVTACNAMGFQVAVAVVDRFGVPQAMLRDRFAGPHTPDTAYRKAWTAVTFRSDTLDLIAPTASGAAQAGARDITNVLILGGGVVIEVAGQVVGAVGVSGAPSGENDAACAEAGLAAIQDKLPL